MIYGRYGGLLDPDPGVPKKPDPNADPALAPDLQFGFHYKALPN